MKVFSLKDLLIEQLKDMYDAEKRLTRALLKMKDAASSRELSSALGDHVTAAETHLSRLDRIFGALDMKPAPRPCEAIRGILSAGEKYAHAGARGEARDAALIAAAQKMRHYKIAAYGCLRDWAEMLGHESAAEMLQCTWSEENEADGRLREIAQRFDVEAIRAAPVGMHRANGNGRGSHSACGPAASPFVRRMPGTVL